MNKFQYYKLAVAVKECKPPSGGHLALCRKTYFKPKLLLSHCQIGKDILNHSRTIASGRFSLRRSWPWSLTLTSQKSAVTYDAGAEQQCQISWKSDWYFSRNHNKRNEL